MASSCPCRDGFFDDVGTCRACHVTCLLCFGATVNSCQSCDIEAKRQALNTQCVCFAGFFEQTPVAQSCFSCPSACSACNSAVVCTSCQPTFYLNANTCTACVRPCVNCVSATTCTSCDQFRYNFNGVACLCHSAFYNQAGFCNPCFYECATCSTNTGCLSCQLGLTIFNSRCIACHPLCLTCSDITVNGCLTCDVNKFRAINGPTPNSCVCISGYFTERNNCVACLERCLTCTSFTRCTSCKAGLILVFDNTCACPLSLFYDSSTLSCRTCVQPCLNCLSSTFCTSCVVGFFLSGFSCLPGCPDGTYPALGGNVIQC